MGLCGTTHSLLMRERKRRETLGGQGCDRFANHTAPCPRSTLRGRTSSAPRGLLCGTHGNAINIIYPEFWQSFPASYLAPAAPSFFGLNSGTLGGLSVL